MKPTILKVVRCSRCRDELSTAELRGGNGFMCALCDNIYAEALEIYQRKRSANTLLKTTHTTPVLRIVPKTNNA
jgi:hypothetical protein